MPKFKIKRDDTVQVTSGRDKGKIGRVLRVLPKEEQIVVERVNVVKRHQKPVGDRPGSIVEREAPLHISKVALYDTKTGSRIKVGWKVLEDGSKVRVDRKTGDLIDNT